ncbi:MAG TPA: DUF72 domain-containing protein [Thermoleophilaceae bacterium]|nr:DUF72 domain-containing protein [Thermoleophilaceae bacterium]
MNPARVGCSGWNYRDWKGDFYPDGLPAKRWLEAYAERFDTVEVNTTFYRLAKRQAVEHWVQQTPPGFVFTVKASRYMTHMKRLQDLAPAIQKFYEPLGPLEQAGRLGPVMWQLPGNFQRDDRRLDGALDLLPPGRHAFEFRHPSWFVPQVMDRLRERGVALVIGDHPERPFQSHDLTADWTLVRFHWGRRGRRGNYSEAEIATWARRLAQWRRRADLYAYFNNDWEGFAPRNALNLAARLTP